MSLRNISLCLLNNTNDSNFKNEFERFKKSAKDISNREFLLAPFINEVILSKNSFAESISTLLATSFESNFISRSTWYKTFLPVFQGNYGDYEEENIISVLIQDIYAIGERDPACSNLVQAFLYFKGFKSLQAYRAAHILWTNSRKDIALAIQSRTSELWAVDIHPASRIGPGFMIDHGTGLVIGETAVVGRDCSFLHGVTLGSTGKDVGDRHPKIGNDVLIGCNAIVLGNITIGNSSKIGSGSVVIKSIPEYVTAVGNPARIVGSSEEEKTKSAAKEMDLALEHVISSNGSHFNSTWSSWADGSVAFDDIDIHRKGCINRDDLKNLFKVKFGHEVSDCCLDVIFPILDSNRDGKICREDFKNNFPQLQPLLRSNFFQNMESMCGANSNNNNNNNNSTISNISNIGSTISLQRRPSSPLKSLPISLSSSSTTTTTITIPNKDIPPTSTPNVPDMNEMRGNDEMFEDNNDLCRSSSEAKDGMMPYMMSFSENDIDNLVINYFKKLNYNSSSHGDGGYI